MRRVQIRALLQNYKEIPTVPSVVETVTALTADVNCSLAALEAAIKIDQSCVARLLQVANSAFYLVFYQFRQLFYAASPLPEPSWDFSDSFSGQPL